MIYLFDIPPTTTSGGTLGIVGAAAFLLIFLGVAFIAFKMLKRSVKMAFRLAIIGVILLIAVAGSAALWGLGTSKAQPPRPARTASR